MVPRKKLNMQSAVKKMRNKDQAEIPPKMFQELLLYATFQWTTGYGSYFQAIISE